MYSQVCGRNIQRGLRALLLNQLCHPQGEPRSRTLDLINFTCYFTRSPPRLSFFRPRFPAAVLTCALAADKLTPADRRVKAPVRFVRERTAKEFREDGGEKG